MYIILWLIFGAIVGWVASLIMKKSASMGLIANIVVGLGGSAIGIALLELFTDVKTNTFTLLGFLASVGGAVLLLAIIVAVRRR